MTLTKHMHEGKQINSQINTVLLMVATGLLSWTVYNTHSLSVEMMRMRGDFMMFQQDVNARLTVSGRNKWGASQQKIWSDELRSDNPTLRVPDPAKVINMYEP